MERGIEETLIYTKILLKKASYEFISKVITEGMKRIEESMED